MTVAVIRVVLRPIQGVDAPVGAEVDVSQWRNAKQLERLRYLGPVVHEGEV